jgi:methylmalonyl-CoA/ethylmalonyl-CoA epimerase
VVPGRKVRTAFFNVEQTKIELIESYDSEGLNGQFIDNNYVSFHDRVFESKNRFYCTPETETKNLQLLDEQSCKDAVGMFNNFLYPELAFDALSEICEN